MRLPVVCRRGAGLVGTGVARGLGWTALRGRPRAAIAGLAVVLLALPLAGCAASGASPPAAAAGPGILADWRIPELLADGAPGVTRLGAPALRGGPRGTSASFDGASDGLVLDRNPLAGHDRFTIEVVMRPAVGGPAEQRYLHFGEVNGPRVMLETRVTPDGRSWYHDSYVQSGGSGLALIDPALLHPTGAWYHVALVFDRGRFATYVDGRRELEGTVAFAPLPPSRVSIGVRQNEVFWYAG